MSAARLAQLYALRAQVEALIALEEMGMTPPPPQLECPHPEEKRRNTSVMGGPRTFLCLQCGQEVEGTA